MELREDTRYTYAVARIRALETRSLNLEKIQRIVDAGDASTAWRETAGWHLLPKGELSPENTQTDLEKFLIEEIRCTNNLFSSLSNDPELTNLFFLKYDFHNLKILLKISPESLDGMVNLGLVPIEKLKESVIERNFRELPKLLQESIREILELVKIDTNLLYGRLDMVDIILDKKMFDLIFRTLKRHPAPSCSFLNMLFQTEVDICNLNICRRFKRLRRNRDFLNEALLPGGKLALKFLLEKYENNEYAPLNEFINFQIATFKLQLNNLYESTIYTAFGLEPLVAFLKKREKDAKMIRMIILAKLQGLAPKAIWGEINTINE
ncbi:hypothetical protein AUJ66_00535 [Candidatus Desantisbacteria bacterium CG1_02_38_46]|uniref:V-type ATP synthase subunit C n=3 Tax=unclassified Candidatus Desantisiibacteriota TaxID=3106372 RepID=A0A2H9PA08_9BACT|nr:MAG: hypothetical protein AUJ66_00535 [Candidatus Desantisbacteria bacterium CG1_02_38_46]PIU51698.1 MAG: hypothetical protein COS91_03050 [Candidatus Desantisbacteria bacterium CG07_land_8_20_14_0_80_39_15]PIZ15182.1 MAG: hypothetical protein COY51_06030 [Candidatus Desantisbacteria bacterium CG_4_10_14_0_8_um_filter_39_17]